MVQRDQWDTYWGAKKLFFLIRDIDGPAMTAASMESCRFVARRSRFGSYLDVGNRLHRMRPGSGHKSTDSLNKSAHWTMNSLAMGSRALEEL
jgi:hypothetical protein